MIVGYWVEDDGFGQVLVVQHRRSRLVHQPLDIFGQGTEYTAVTETYTDEERFYDPHEIAWRVEMLKTEVNRS